MNLEASLFSQLFFDAQILALAQGSELAIFELLKL